MPDLVHNRSELQAELESAAAEVHFGDSEPANESRPLREPAAEPVPMLVTDAGDLPEPVPLWRDRQAWISGLSSFSVHLAALLVLALAAMTLRDENVVEAVNATLGDEEIAGLEAIAVPAELPRFELEASPTLNLDPAEMQKITPGDLDRRFAADQFAPAFAAQNSADGSGFQFQKPTDGNAVTKGSFAVWTEPNDPRPGEKYLIIIEVKVPDGLDEFPASDLNIEVIGTDNFRLTIPGPRTPPWLQGNLQILGGKVQIPIWIPGAEADVRDTINVRSVKILKERQRMRITF